MKMTRGSESTFFGLASCRKGVILLFTTSNALSSTSLTTTSSNSPASLLASISLDAADTLLSMLASVSVFLSLSRFSSWSREGGARNTYSPLIPLLLRSLAPFTSTSSTGSRPLDMTSSSAARLVPYSSPWTSLTSRNSPRSTRFLISSWLVNQYSLPSTSPDRGCLVVWLTQKPIFPASSSFSLLIIVPFPTPDGPQMTTVCMS
mmetsp:Transcript_4966/g.17952  ORF Transcript_4966/g.17952 Transcript_4966/m.17952 type:complete len:205 (+) Transcript_4966:709-1323(+)